MAERYTEVPLPLPMVSIEVCIDEKFDQLIVCLNLRREQLIAEHRGRQEERRADTISRIQTLQQLTESKTHLQTEMKENALHSMRERMVEEIETKMRQLEAVEREVEFLFECDTQQLEETISILGKLVEREFVPTPSYPAFQQPRISVLKESPVESQGKCLGELDCPEGVAFDEKSQLIYVADSNISSGCINLFSVTGEYISTFCKERVMSPVGIAINGDEVYVSDAYLHSIFHFKLPDFKLVAKVGKKGTGKGEFSSPQQLTVAPNGFVFVADSYNNRVVVLTNKLKFQQSISHVTMTRPRDVKLLDNKVYVLSCKDNPCLHVFSQSGKKLRSFITSGTQGNEQVKGGYFFCFNKQQNILISDFLDNSIKVFSQEGALLHTLGYTQEKEKKFKPMGIIVTNNNQVISTSYLTMFCLHFFC